MNSRLEFLDKYVHISEEHWDHETSCFIYCSAVIVETIEMTERHEHLDKQ